MATSIFFVDCNFGNNASAGTSVGAAWKTINHALSGAGTSAAVATAIGNNDDIEIRVIGEANPTNQSVVAPATLVGYVAGTPAVNFYHPIQIIATPYGDGSIPDLSSTTKVRWDGTACDTVLADAGLSKPHYMFRNIDFYRDPADAYAGALGHGVNLTAANQYGHHFYNCKFSNHKRWGLNTSHFQMACTKCIFENCNTVSATSLGGGGVKAYQITDCEIIDCNIVGAALLAYTQEGVIAGCKVRDCTGTGIYIANTNTTFLPFLVDRCTVYGCGTGISIELNSPTICPAGHVYLINRCIISACTTGLNCPETEVGKVTRTWVKDTLFFNNSTHYSNINIMKDRLLEGNTADADPGFYDTATGDLRIDPDGAGVLGDNTVLGGYPLSSLGAGSGRVKKQYYFYPI